MVAHARGSGAVLCSTVRAAPLHRSTVLARWPRAAPTLVVPAGVDRGVAIQTELLVRLAPLRHDARVGIESAALGLQMPRLLIADSGLGSLPNVKPQNRGTAADSGAYRSDPAPRPQRSLRIIGQTLRRWHKHAPAQKATFGSTQGLFIGRTLLRRQFVRPGLRAEWIAPCFQGAVRVCELERFVVDCFARRELAAFPDQAHEPLGGSQQSEGSGVQHADPFHSSMLRPRRLSCKSQEF